MARCAEQEYEIVSEVESLIEEITLQLSNLSYKEAYSKAQAYNKKHFLGNKVITVEKSTTERDGRPYVDFSKTEKTKAIQDKIVEDNKLQDKAELEERMRELEDGRNMDEDLMPMQTSTIEYDEFNYGEALSNKLLFKERIEERRNLLLNREKTKENLRQIEEINDLSKRLYKDIQNLNKVEASLSSYLDNVDKDLEYIRILLKNPTMDNIEIIGDYLEVLDSMTKSDSGDFLQESIEEIENRSIEAKKNGDTEEYEDLKKVVKALKSTRSAVGSLKAEYEDKNEGLILTAIESHIKNIDDNVEWEEAELKAEAKRLYENQKDKGKKKAFGSDLGTKFTTLDGKEEDNVIMSVIFKIHADALKMTNVKRLSQEALNIKDKLTQELIDKGHVKGRGFFKSPSFDIFKREGKGIYQLIGKFSDKWDNFKKEQKAIQANIATILYNPNISPDQILEVKKQFDTLNKEVDFLDLSLVPEIVGDSDFSEFDKYFTSKQDIEEQKRYKAEIIAKIGEREYKKLVEKQKENLYSYQTFVESSENRLRIKFELEDDQNIQESIPERDWNLHLHYLASKSPFAFNEAFKKNGTNVIEKSYFVNGKEHKANNSFADLEYVSYFPKSDRFFDSNFERIESNDVFKKAWGHLADLNDYISANGYNKDPEGLNEHSLAYQVREVKTLKKKFLKFFSKETLRNIHKHMTTAGFRDTSKDQNVTGGMTSVDEHIEAYYKREMAIRFPGKNATTQEKEAIREEAKEEVMKHQNENIFDNILSHAEIVSKFKASREIESKLRFFQNWYKDNAGSQQYNELIQYFIDKNLYGINNRENWNETGILGMLSHDKVAVANFAKYYTDNEKELRKRTLKAMKSLRKYQNTADLTEAENKKIQFEIDAYQAYMDSGGKYLTGGSLIEASVVKVTRFGAFALNAKAQVNNMVIGQQTAIAVDGREGFWKPGVYDRASYLLDKKRIPFRSKKDKKTIDIIDLILGGSDLFQNSANEMINLKKTRGLSVMEAVIENPINFVSEVEKTIQRPQIISLMSEIKIEGKDAEGNVTEVAMFDPATLSFPAFDIKDGNLTLKPEFESEDNRQTFIEFKSQRFANLFGDAGLIPNKISYINGNYKDTNVYLFQKQQMTSIPMMFKTWMPATYKKYFDAMTNLGEKEEGTLARNALMLKAAAYGANFGLAAGIGAMAMGIGFSLHAQAKGIKRTQKEMGEEAGRMMTAFKIMKDTMLSINLIPTVPGMKNTANFALASLAQAVSNLLPLQTFTKGVRLFDSEKIKSIMTVRSEKQNGEPLTAEEVKSIKDDLYMLSTVLAKSIQYMAYRYMAMMFLAPDEDEKEAYDAMVLKGGKESFFDFETMKFGKNKFWGRMIQDPSTSMYFILENMLSAITQDFNIMINAEGTYRLSETNYIDDLIVLGDDIIKSTQGQTRLLRGPNEGKIRFWSHLETFYTPSALKGGLSGGFASMSKRDFDKNNMIDKAATPAVDRINDARLQARAIEKNRLQSKGIEESRINKLLLERFPVIHDDDVNSKGELFPSKKYKVERYWGEWYEFWK